jgi:hypothetical protein
MRFKLWQIKDVTEFIFEKFLGPGISRMLLPNQRIALRLGFTLKLGVTLVCLVLDFFTAHSVHPASMHVELCIYTTAAN